MEASDVAAVVNTVNLYPIAVDSMQWTLFDQVFTEDAETDFGGPAVFSGLANIKLVFDAIHAPFKATQHATRGHHVHVTGDRATCISYVHAHFIRDVPGDGGNMFESIGWYDDLLVRTPLGWRIARRVCRTTWSGGNPAVLQTTPDVHVEAVCHSLRGESSTGDVAHIAGMLAQRS